MNENKGSKGSGRDLRRLFRFLFSKKKKDEELKNEESKKKTTNNVVVPPITINDKEVVNENIEYKVNQTNNNNTKLDEITRSKEFNDISVYEDKKDITPIIPIINTKENILNNEKDSKEQVINYEKELLEKKIEINLIANINSIEDKLEDLEFSYYCLCNEKVNPLNEKEQEERIRRISLIIEELEKLKRKLDINRADNYDLYNEITDYINSINENDIINYIKIYPLYNEINDKILSFKEESNQLENEFNNSLEQTKINNKVLNNKKEKYYDIKIINNSISKQLEHQQIIMFDLMDKVSKCETIEMRTKITYLGLSEMTKSLMERSKRLKSIPGTSPSVLMAVRFRLATRFIKDMLFPKKKYDIEQERIVKDYTKEIENALNDIDSTKKLISDTINDIDDIINDLELNMVNDYQYKELLYNLKIMRDSVKKKHEKLEMIKINTNNSLENNKQKLLTR